MCSNNFKAVVGVVALLAMAACHRTPTKSEQLEALDIAYKSGVFTKEEYDAKRIALVGPPAATAATPPTQALPQPAPADAPVAMPPAGKQAAGPASIVLPALAPPAVKQTTPPPEPKPVAAPPEPPPSAPPPVVATAKAPAVSAPPASNTCDDPKSHQGEDSRFFSASPERVRTAALAALDKLDFNIKSTGKDLIEATKRRHLSAVVGGGGEKVTLHFEAARQADRSGTRVSGETKKSFVGRVAQRSQTAAVLTEIGCILDGRR